MTDLQEYKKYWLECFPNSWYNENNEFIAHTKSNTYFIFGNCKNTEDVECKILKGLSRSAAKGQPYSQEWRNRKFRKFMLDGINSALETDFSTDDIKLIYQKLGNRINHDLTVKFAENGFDMKVLKGGAE